MDESAPRTLEAREILDFLPHRYPFLLVDRVVKIEDTRRLVAIKNVTINEPFFAGHFPGHPVMPGVLIIEAMAQAAAILGCLVTGARNDGRTVFYFGGIDGARFKRPVVPGDRLELEVELLKLVRGIAKYRAVARVEGALVSEAELLCTVKTVP